MPSSKLTVAEAIARAEMIDRGLKAWTDTAPRTVEVLGGRDGLAGLSQMTCVGPVPRLDAETWEAALSEYEDARRPDHPLTR